MAEQKTPAKAPAAKPANGTPEAKPAPAPKPTVDAEGKKILDVAQKREALKVRYKTEAEAVTEAQTRAKGARTPFKVTLKGQEPFWMVAAARNQVAERVFLDEGNDIQEVGKQPRGTRESKPLTIGTILEQLNNLPADQKAQILAQLKA